LNFWDRDVKLYGWWEVVKEMQRESPLVQVRMKLGLITMVRAQVPIDFRDESNLYIYV
jgi:hypothetical protein